MLIVADAYKKAGLDFAQHAVAITMSGSKMDKMAVEDKWLARFPMFDWIGGRTSELSAVGLLPAALQGIDIQAMLDGAAAMDVATRTHDTAKNPAALLALMWYHATDGKGEKDMVVLPYKDRLLLFSRYLQQLVMESLGKRLDLDGKRVDQGISVFGNKGSTDQHAYVQQLRDGVNNFFIDLHPRARKTAASNIEVEPGATAGDFLHGFLLGTREALFGNDRQSMTITINRVDPTNHRRADRAVRTGRRFLRHAGQRQRLSSTRRGSRQKSRSGGAGAAGQDRRRTSGSATDRGSDRGQKIGAASTRPRTSICFCEHLAANGRAKASGTRRPRQGGVCVGLAFQEIFHHEVTKHEELPRLIRHSLRVFVTSFGSRPLFDRGRYACFSQAILAARTSAGDV